MNKEDLEFDLENESNLSELEDEFDEEEETDPNVGYNDPKTTDVIEEEKTSEPIKEEKKLQGSLVIIPTDPKEVTGNKDRGSENNTDGFKYVSDTKKVKEILSREELSSDDFITLRANFRLEKVENGY